MAGESVLEDQDSLSPKDEAVRFVQLRHVLHLSNACAYYVLLALRLATMQQEAVFSLAEAHLSPRKTLSL
jgi:hypothetical protein